MENRWDNAISLVIGMQKTKELLKGGEGRKMEAELNSGGMRHRGRRRRWEGMDGKVAWIEPSWRVGAGERESQPKVAACVWRDNGTE